MLENIKAVCAFFATLKGIIIGVLTVFATLVTLLTFFTDYSSLSKIREYFWPDKGVLLHPENGLLDIKNGNLKFSVDDQLVIQEITYRLETCSVSLGSPRDLDFLKLPVTFDIEEGAWKIRTNLLSINFSSNTWSVLNVPEKIGVTIRGFRRGDNGFLHVFTDQEYITAINSVLSDGTAQVQVQIGTSGFTSFLDLVDMRVPRLWSTRQKNMIEPRLGPLAVLIVSAEKKGDVRRSKPVLVLRSGLRTPDDRWVINGALQLAYVDKLRPPLVVFQSTRVCNPPRLQSIYAGTIDGEVYELSPSKLAQNTLIRTEPGPPGIVYFRSNYKTLSQRVCYRVVLSGGPIPSPERVPEEQCGAQAH